MIIENKIKEVYGVLYIIKKSVDDRKTVLNHVSYIHSIAERDEVKNHPSGAFISILYKALEDCIDLKDPQHKIVPDNDIKRICNNAVRLIEFASRINLQEGEDLPKIKDYSINELNRIISRTLCLYRSIIIQPDIFHMKNTVAESILAIFDFSGYKYLKESIIARCKDDDDSMGVYDLLLKDKANEYAEIINKHCSGSDSIREEKYLDARSGIEMLHFKAEKYYEYLLELENDPVFKNSIRKHLLSLITEIEDIRSEVYEKIIWS